MLIAIPERLKLYTLKYIKSPPTIATTTYRIFPILFKIGPSILAYELAF